MKTDAFGSWQLGRKRRKKNCGLVHGLGDELTRSYFHPFLALHTPRLLCKIIIRLYSQSTLKIFSLYSQKQTNYVGLNYFNGELQYILHTKNGRNNLNVAGLADHHGEQHVVSHGTTSLDSSRKSFSLHPRDQHEGVSSRPSLR